MADMCVDCAEYEGHHDMGNVTAWALCEGCGYHVFANGARLCRRGAWPSDEATYEPCPLCLAMLVGPSGS